jgi:histidyl-tRNA synthetase
MGDVIIELLLDQTGRRPELRESPSQVLVTLFSEDLYEPTLVLAARLRAAGLNVEQILEPIRLGKQFRYADRKGIPFVAILGPDEVKAGHLVVKNMATGEQRAYTDQEVVETLKKA